MKSKRRYRILYVLSASGGGSSISLYELLRGLDFEKYCPTVLFYVPNIFEDKFKELGIKVITLSKKQPSFSIKNSSRWRLKIRDYCKWLITCYREVKQIYHTFRRDWPVANQIAKLIKTEGIEFVHNNNGLVRNRAAIMAGRLSGVPQVCHVRMYHKLSLVDKYFHKYINHFIYISSAIEKSYIEQGIPKNKGSVVYNGINDNDFQIDLLPTTIRSEFKLHDYDRLICNVGRLDWWKGHDYFIKAMFEVIKKEPRTKAAIVGPEVNNQLSQEYFQRVKELVKKLQLSNHIFFTGFRKDVPHILSASEIVVHSASEPEPFGRVIVEGMMAGRPVVATATGGVLEIIENNSTGLLVSPKDSNSMAKAIIHLLSNPIDAKRIGQRARKTARQRFNVEMHVKGINDIYNKYLFSYKK